MPVAFTAGQKLRAADLNYAPIEWVLGGQYRTTTISGFTVETVVLTTPSVTIPASCTVAIELDAMWEAASTSEQLSFIIRQTNLTGAVVQQGFTLPNATGGSGPYPFNMRGFYAAGPSAPVTINFVATCQFAVGTGAMSVLPSSSLMVKQLGGVPNNITTT